MTMNFHRFLLAGLCLVCGPKTFADVYKFVGRDGHVEYTDKPGHSGFNLIIRTPEPVNKPVKVSFGDRDGFTGRGRTLSLRSPRRPLYPVYDPEVERNREQYAGVIQQAARRHNLDPALLHAVIRAESSYNPDAVSHKGAMGLMQLMPGTAARYGVRNPYDPAENVHGGAHYLSDLLDLFQSDVRLAVAAYNAGENNVIKYGHRVPPFQETQNYVSKVLGFYGRGRYFN